MKGWLRIGVAVLVGQAVLLAAYWLVEHRRSSETALPELSVAPPAHVDGLLPPLSLRTPDGSRLKWRSPERATLVHFWATWCAPCRAELPALLRLQSEHAVDVVAVALDRSWAPIEQLFGKRPANVYLGEVDEVQLGLDVHSLPVTYLVQPGGRLQLRFDGARDWTDADFLSRWTREVAPR